MLLELLEEAVPVVAQAAQVDEVHAGPLAAAAGVMAQQLVLFLAAALERAHRGDVLHERLRLGARLADLLEAGGVRLEHLAPLAHPLVDLLLVGLRLAAQRAQERFVDPLDLLVDGRLDGRQGDQVAVHLEARGHALARALALAQRLEVGVVLLHGVHVLVDEGLHVFDGAQRHPVLQALELVLQAHEERLRALVHAGDGSAVALGHAPEEGRLRDAPEGAGDAQELLDGLVVRRAHLLERRVELQAAVLEDHAHLCLRHVLVEALEAHLVLVLQDLEQLVVPVHAPLARVVWVQPHAALDLVEGQAQVLDALLPAVAGAHEVDRHERGHLVAHARVVRAQAAVLRREI
mmetsp:Transcript_11060/g.45931  ORF Transcript_11060/g.45931 Transcript_11060/m.45931 type:complete len:349 (-) Transcript_11060:817-1863(-)